jgi:hypothetical protein
MMNVSRLINFSTIFLFLVTATQFSCSSCGSDGTSSQDERLKKEARLKKLQAEEVELTNALQKAMDPDKWEEFKQLNLKRAIKDLQTTGGFILSAKKDIDGLYQSRAMRSNAVFDGPNMITGETLSGMLHRMSQYGFRVYIHKDLVKDADEAIAALTIWRDVLYNLKDQHELRRDLGEK